MFRARRSPVNSGVSGALVCVFALILSAGGIAWRQSREAQHEADVIGRAIPQLPPKSARGFSSLPGELRWQFSSSRWVLFSGAVTIGALVILTKACWSSPASLRQVGVLGGDILASMDQAVISTDANGTVTGINPRTETMFGAVSACVGKPVEWMVAGDATLAELCRTVLVNYESVHDRDLPWQRDGRIQYYRADCCPIRDAQGHVRGTVLYVRDATEHVLMEQRMRRMERSMGLGSLAAGLHHEIKNPLGALSLHVQLLEERLDELDVPRDVLEMLGVVSTEVMRINGVLESFRSFATNQALHSESTRLTQLVEKVVRFVKPQAELQHVAIKVEQAARLPNLWLDPGRMDQLLLNLVVNALEAMPDGGTLTLSLSRHDGHCLLAVQDTGCGIPDSIRGSIFDPYFTTKSEGTGLGLALCDKFVRQHNGQIDVQSCPQGTTFVVKLPIDAVAEAVASWRVASG